MINYFLYGFNKTFLIILKAVKISIVFSSFCILLNSISIKGFNYGLDKLFNDINYLIASKTTTGS